MNCFSPSRDHTLPILDSQTTIVLTARKTCFDLFRFVFREQLIGDKSKCGEEADRKRCALMPVICLPAKSKPGGK